MRFKEFLVEMATKISKIETGKRVLYVEIRTSNFGGFSAGLTEHYPAHIHILCGNELDIPIELIPNKNASECILSGKSHKTIGSLSKEEFAYIDDFIRYYGCENLKKIFDSAMKSQDPEVLFKQLKIKTDLEWNKIHEDPKTFGYKGRRKKGKNKLW